MKPTLFLLLLPLVLAKGPREKRLKLEIDESLSHAGKAFQTDSVLAVSYNKHFWEGHELPVEKDGSWQNTLEKIVKLSPAQVAKFHAILGSGKTYKNPAGAGCYEPRLGLVFFRGGKVVAQSAICTSCMRLQSTAKLGDGSHYAAFNVKALKRLEKLERELGF